jgi:hypothetical protein
LVQDGTNKDISRGTQILGILLKVELKGFTGVLVEKRRKQQKFRISSKFTT